uniref:BTB domain-containing protein n=1 Tax=Globodera pallida TaxID=36090 RepID=A0A183BPV6_GLOPA
MSSTRVYFGHLPFRATENDLEHFLRGYGRFRDITMKNGYAFVEFDDMRDADDVVYDLNGRVLLGQQVIVEMARSENKYRRSGRIVFRVDNFKAFCEGRVPEQLISDSAEFINGLPWRIMIDVSTDAQKFLKFFVLCDGDKNDKAWSCQAATRLGIVSCDKRIENFMEQEETRDVFNAKTRAWGSRTFIKIEELLDRKRALYNEVDDVVTFLVDVIAEKPNGMPGVRTEDILLVNGKETNVNKHQLAAHSDFFKTLFFGENAEQTPEIEIDDLTDAVQQFERLLATMEPKNMELDDECIESVLHLANRFLLGSVENRCVEFLKRTSKKPALSKFRLADEYGFVALKSHILEYMTRDDFAGENYLENLSENNKLGEEAANELSERHKELFGPPSKRARKSFMYTVE